MKKRQITICGLIAALTLVLGMTVIACDDNPGSGTGGDGDKKTHNTDPKSITISGIDSSLNGNTFGVVLSSALMGSDESSIVAAGTGTVASGSVTIALMVPTFSDGDMTIGTTAYTGSGSFFAVMAIDIEDGGSFEGEQYFYTDGKKTIGDFFTDAELAILTAQVAEIESDTGAYQVYVNAMAQKVPKLSVSSKTTSVAYTKFVSMTELSAMFGGGDDGDTYFYNKEASEVYLRAASWTDGEYSGKNWNTGGGIRLSDVDFDGTLENNTKYKITISGTTDKAFTAFGVMFYDENYNSLAHWHTRHEVPAGQFSLEIIRTITSDADIPANLDEIIVELSTDDDFDVDDGTLMATITDFSMTIEKYYTIVDNWVYMDMKTDLLLVFFFYEGYDGNDGFWDLYTGSASNENGGFGYTDWYKSGTYTVSGTTITLTVIGGLVENENEETMEDQPYVWVDDLGEPYQTEVGIMEGDTFTLGKDNEAKVFTRDDSWWY